MASVLLSSCGMSKKKEAQVVNTKADYAFILKFHEGVRLKSRGQTDAAIETFQACLRMREDDASNFALFELYLEKEQRQEASQYLQKAYKLDPNNIHYTTELAYDYFETGKFSDAVNIFKKLCKLQPRNPDFQYGLAESYVRAGKPADAIEALNRTQDQTGLIPELVVQKYTLYMQMKKPELALQELNSALEEMPADPQLISTLADYYFKQNQEDKAIEALERMAEAQPENGRVQYYLAEVYGQKRDMDKYFYYLKRAFEGGGVELDQKMKALLSLQEKGLGKDPRSFELVERLVTDYPTEAKPYTLYADYMMEKGDDDNALKYYSKALQYEKNAFAIWKQVMVMQYQNSLFEDLLKSSGECLMYFPNVPLVYLFNGVACNQTKKYADGLTVLEAGIDYVVNDKPLKAEFYGQLGECYFLQMKVKEGKENYELALKTDPSSILLMNNYAFRLANAKIELNKALQLMEDVLAVAADQAHYLDTYGWIYFQMGKYEDAKKWFEKAYAADKEDKFIVEHMGDVLIKLGKKKEALEYWKLAHTMGSTNGSLDKKIANEEYFDPIF